MNIRKGNTQGSGSLNLILNLARRCSRISMVLGSREGSRSPLHGSQGRTSTHLPRCKINGEEDWDGGLNNIKGQPGPLMETFKGNSNNK